MAQGIFTLKQANQAIRQGAWSSYTPPQFLEYLVVAGGGAGYYSGGAGGAGGGGAGGLLTGSVDITAGASYFVTVGAGAASASTSNGSNSAFDAITSGAFTGRIVANGGASPSAANASGTSGGSGSGAGENNGAGILAGGLGIPGQGNPGGGSAHNYNGAGGGGAGTAGLSNSSTYNPGNGGAGIASSISGALTVYAGGGGGAGYLSGSVGGRGGVGGGGQGSLVAVTNATSGNVNTGGGGGAKGVLGSGTTAGGSGIVIVRYPGNIVFYTGGTVNYNNGYISHIFNSNGTLAPTTPAPYDTSYQISRSLRFNSADSANLTRTPASATNQKTWTWSGWVKRSALRASLSDPATIFNAGGNGFLARFSYANQDQLEFYNFSSSAYQLEVITTAVFRDVSAWYHIVFVLDTTQATSSNRFKVYVNGTQVTAFSTATYPSQNADLLVNNTSVHALGVLNGIGGYYSGYMTEINFIDGQALTPSSFGATSTTTGVWAPIKYAGTYGTNGFYLNFSDNSNTTAATLGKDYSGNGNNWTPNNFSVTAGAGNDSLVDSPTSYGTDTGVGGTVRGNYATLNPLAKTASGLTLTNGNLDGEITTAIGTFVAYATIGMSSGKWYWEVTCVTGGNAYMIGIGKDGGLFDWQTTNGYSYFASNGNKYNNSAGSAYGATFTNGDVIGVALDMDAGTLAFYKNGTSQGTAFSSLSGTYFPCLQNAGNLCTQTYNFGQRPFAYTAPSGYKALCTQNLSEPAIGGSSETLASKFFNTVLWTGTGSSLGVTGVGFQPDWVWAKGRSVTYSHGLFDAVRGATKKLSSNLTGAEVTESGLTAFNSDGFTLGSDAGLNQSTSTYVAWNWKAGNSKGSRNTAGSLASEVSANPTAGFSVVTMTYTSVAGTVGHGLGVAPQMIIVKSRGGAGAWYVAHTGLTNMSGYYILLNSTSAEGAANWGGSPTSTTFNMSNNLFGSDTYVAYCFAEVAGYSKFGSYTGNGSVDGPFVHTGFRPAFILIKRTDTGSSDWQIIDTKRDTYNASGLLLQPNLTNTESDARPVLDILSNGFKHRNTYNVTNVSAATYIYMAFAENPFKYSLAR